MQRQLLYHGASGDVILKILNSGKMLPKDGEIYFVKFEPDSVFQYGPDSVRGASFVIQVLVELSVDVRRLCLSRPGAPRDSIVLVTNSPLSVEVRELYVRRLGSLDGDEPPSRERIIGADTIRQYLQTP
jgi:hypothetical protein